MVTELKRMMVPAFYKRYCPVLHVAEHITEIRQFVIGKFGNIGTGIPLKKNFIISAEIRMTIMARK